VEVGGASRRTILAMPAPAQSSAPLHFRRRHRLSGARSFGAVYEAKLRKRRGPLTVFALPNGLGHPRLGLSVGRRVGNAVTRHAIKRRLREAFRHLQHRFERPYDLVVNVAPHSPVMGMDEYRRLLEDAWRALDREWCKRDQEGG